MKKSVKITVYVVMAFLLFIVVKAKFTNQQVKNLISPFVAQFGSSTSLGSVVNEALKDTEGNYAVYIKNFKKGETIKLKEKESFDAGSLYKLWLVGAVFEQIKDGNLKGDEVLSSKIEDLNKKFEIASGDAELTDGSIELTVNDAMKQTITISHNYAALLLTSKIGVSKISEFLRKHNLSDSSTGSPPKTTAADIAKFYEALYKGELLGEEYSKEMLELLSKQQINDRLPKNLPQGVRIAHKTADIGLFEHDAGIVYTDKGDYIIVVLSESDFPQGAGERIADLSKAVYEYFNKDS